MKYYSVCPICLIFPHNLSFPYDFSMGIEYVVCQDCGLRIDEKSWESVPRDESKIEYIDKNVRSKVKTKCKNILEGHLGE